MQRAQHSKRKNAASGAPIEAEGSLELLRYTAPVGLIPSWADLAFGRGVPPESSMPLLYLLYYHKADVTSQTFALCSQNDGLHDAYQSTGHVGPKTGRPAPGGDPNCKEIIKRRRGRLQPTIIEDDGYF